MQTVIVKFLEKVLYGFGFGLGMTTAYLIKPSK